VVVNRRHAKDPFAVEAERSHLHDDREGLHDKDAADDEQHQFLLGNDGNRPQGAAEGEAADIAHKDLGGVSVEPEEAEPRPDHSATEDAELAGAIDAGDLQVRCHLKVAGGISEDQISGGGNHHRPDRQTVEAVGEVDGIAGTDNHQNRKGDVEEAKIGTEGLEEGEGHGRFKAAVIKEERCYAGDERQPEHLLAGGESLAVLLLDFTPVIDKADRAKADGDKEDNPDIEIGQIRPEEGRQNDGEED
jgi:hypothetical protein